MEIMVLAQAEYRNLHKHDTTNECPVRKKILPCTSFVIHNICLQTTVLCTTVTRIQHDISATIKALKSYTITLTA